MIDKYNDYLHLSITATGRCNAACDYCHFYAKRSREKINFDINEHIFRYYIDLIRYIINEKGHEKITYRLSGGEPLVMGQKMFEMCNYAYKNIGKKINILTNGIALNDNVIKESIKANIGTYIVSIENPFEIAYGAANPYEIIKKIKKYNSEDVRVVPGVVIVSNRMFSKLETICDFFYENIGFIPPISEKTYSAYESPSIEELHALKENISNIVYKYAAKTSLELFPYIIPEIINGGGKEYIAELDLEGKVIKESYDVSYECLLTNIANSYPRVSCDKECEWKDYCDNRKWLWDYKTNSINVENKREDYCNYKKALCEGYLEGLTRLERKYE